MQQCERAIFDLRRGVATLLLAGDGDRLILPVESGTARSRATLARAAAGSPRLVLGRERLAALGYERAPEAACLPVPEHAEALAALAWGRVADDGSARAALAPASEGERAAVALLKRALLVPAVLSAPIDRAERERLVRERVALDVSVEEIGSAVEATAARVEQVSAADVPLEGAPATRFILFREPDGLREHVVVRIGDPEAWPPAVPVRLHSACLTGDLFGSLRCDCGEQLRSGVERISCAGGGVLLYLAQEGRGIGLANKLRAYALQDRGADTVDADAQLGFGEDERRYDVAVAILRVLGIQRIRLLTNNPAKIAAIEAGGIAIEGRDELYGRLNRHNERYLRAKATRSGHLLAEWLDTGAARE